MDKWMKHIITLCNSEIIVLSGLCKAFSKHNETAFSVIQIYHSDRKYDRQLLSQQKQSLSKMDEMTVSYHIDLMFFTGQ